jgi:hypothetical protein
LSDYIACVATVQEKLPTKKKQWLNKKNNSIEKQLKN